MDRLWYLGLFFLSCNQLVLATDSCTRTVQANVDEEGDDVMLLAMPQRPRPTRKQSQRSLADSDATSLFQVDEVSMPSVIVKSDSDETLMSHSWMLVFVSVLLFILLLGMCALQNSKEDGNRELQTLVSRLSVKSAEELLNQFESPKDPSMQKLGITRIQGRVVAKNAQTMATPFSDQQCVMYSASASQKRQDGVHQPPLAYHAACSDFAIELEGPTPLQISVHGHDVSLFQMSQGRFCKEASFSEVPEPWRGFALAHLIHGVVDASCNAMSCVDLGAQGTLEFCESALLHGSRVTCVGEVVRDRNGELSLCPWRPLVEGVEAPVEKRRLFPLQFSATSWETSTSSQLAGQVLISDNSQFFENFALWRWMGGHTPAASLLNA